MTSFAKPLNEHLLSFDESISEDDTCADSFSRPIVCTLIALPLAAQNTDIESLSGLQFNFGNPGARSLGMGGAFLGLADDASAAEANPAGLTILRKPEITIEGRNYQEQQVFTTSGTFPDLAAHRLQPLQPAHRRHVRQRRLSHQALHLRRVLPRAAAQRRDGPGRAGAQRFHRRDQDRRSELLLPVDGQGNLIGTPISAAQCNALRQKDPFTCLEYTVLPFLSAVKIQEKTFGVAAAFKIGKFSFGATARSQRFNETAFTFRVTPTVRFLQHLRAGHERHPQEQ